MTRNYCQKYPSLLTKNYAKKHIDKKLKNDNKTLFFLDYYVPLLYNNKRNYLMQKNKVGGEHSNEYKHK